MQNATKKYRGEFIVNSLMMDVARLEASMVPGREDEHLLSIVRKTSHRGTDVRLLSTQFLCEEEIVPYPALRWFWQEILAWPWQEEQHINVLEAQALLTYMRRKARDLSQRDQRYVHVLDSRVVTAVLAKGRSRSRRLSRIARRIMAVSIAANLYPMGLWTLSSWNFSDAASRRFDTEVEV